MGIEQIDVEPCILEGDSVRLEPMTTMHVDALARVGLDPALWQWIPVPITTPNEMREYVEIALDELRRQVSIPFVIIDRRSQQVVGSTRYAAIERKHRRLEIGWTWITPSYQRTATNTETKLLLLRHAFEAVGVQRVELKTDALNQQSRTAILRIGAKEEGTLRKHFLTASGRFRDTVYFSILDSEWPAIKSRLQSRLRGRAQ